MKIQLRHTFEDIISVDNLLAAWKEFVCGKRGKRDVQEFALRLMDNIFDLHADLQALRYRHGPYHAFTINDPKPRSIHKASVRDRLLHHAIYRILYPFFDRTFIADSYACRIRKGSHRALDRFTAFAYRVSKNHTRTCWVLKCDIKKFFASIDHAVLFGILQTYIFDAKILWLLQNVVQSFSSIAPGKSLPLGNLTSQLFVNVYMNMFDQWVKHFLHAKGYVRYADDFAVFSYDRAALVCAVPCVEKYLRERLHLALHPKKVSIRTVASGVDFLGWMHFFDHRVLRTATKRRMFRQLKQKKTPATLQSYLGLLKHGNTAKLQKIIMKTNLPFSSQDS